MFNPFKKKSALENLQDKYKKLLAEAHSLSQRDRKAGDQKMVEAEEVGKQIEALRAK
ncbi:Lacal_2735 family protein [Catalinimonas niigatensis]|uniref:Lacal_2735 family protein n=1 Tax=Catalinimonas niigatensis TaxID=1397264 RepID=UPI00266648F5|nr:Lacal_2735 family protein [Catalinimonas niigatensis]WPP51298.1 Lacal_2735 family protein [Catalinimonas niigatensis]